jgi:hypothetical protein
MAYMPTPIKTAAIKFGKSFPDVTMADEIDFETWGSQVHSHHSKLLDILTFMKQNQLL